MKSIYSVVLLIGVMMVLLSGISNTVRAQVRPASTDELTRLADIVVVGKIADVKAGWNSDRSRIYTTVTVAVDQTLKGDAGTTTASILVPGGEVDGVGEMYSHSVQFKKDEEVVVFARKDKQGRLRVVSGEHGKLSVSQDAATGARVVSGESTLTELTRRVKIVAGEVLK